MLSFKVKFQTGHQPTPVAMVTKFSHVAASSASTKQRRATVTLAFNNVIITLRYIVILKYRIKYVLLTSWL